MRELSLIRPLDGLRALAILLVLVWHYVTCQISDSATGWLHAVKALTFWTWSGVDLFFVLSGFLIGRILIANKHSGNYFKTFYLRRFFRIFPAYSLVVGVFVAVLLAGLAPQLPWLLEHPLPIYAYLLYIQNFWMTGWDFGANWLSVTWSLAIEEQFYLLLPLAVFLIRDKWLPFLLIAGIIAAPFFRMALPALGAYVLLPARMDALLMGVLIARYYLGGKIQSYFTGKGRGLFFTALLLLALVFVCGKGPLNETFGGVLIHSLLALFYSILLTLALTLDDTHGFTKFLSGGALKFIAMISFMVYLTHQVFSGLFHQLLLHQEPQMTNYRDVLVTLLSLAVTVLFSALSYYAFEKPVLQLGKRYNY